MLLRVCLLFFLATALAGCAGRTRTDNKTRALLRLEIGTSHLMNGNYPAALSELLAAEKLDPTEPTIQNNLGLAYLVREKYDDAERCFKKAIKLKKDYTDARNNLGRLYIDVGLYDKAISELEIAAADLTYPQPEKSWANLGQALFFAQKYERAKIALQNSLKERRDSCFTMNYYGRTLFELKNFKTAAESLDQAVKLCEKSDFDEPHFYSALSFIKLGQLDQARARLTEVIKLYPRGQYNQKAQEMLETLK